MRSARYVETWRNLPNPDQWQVTPETARLLKHWRHHHLPGCQAFLLPDRGRRDCHLADRGCAENGRARRQFWDHLEGANEQANPELLRLALKLATGAGKTTVMAMLIAWQTVNAVRHPSSKTFSRGFLIVAPGITIRDRLRVLQPNDPDSYYRNREIVPTDMLGDIDHGQDRHHQLPRLQAARADGARERHARAARQGRGEELQTLETEGQMLQRVMPELMGIKNIVVLNDEAHHCYREKPRSR